MSYVYVLKHSDIIHAFKNLSTKKCEHCLETMFTFFNFYKMYGEKLSFL